MRQKLLQQLRKAAGLQPLQDFCPVDFDRAWAQSQFLGDFLGLKPSHQVVEHITLTLGQSGALVFER